MIDRENDQAVIDAWVASEGADPEKGRIFFERFNELLQRLESERMTLEEAAKFMNVPYPVFRRIWAVRLARENVGRSW